MNSAKPAQARTGKLIGKKKHVFGKTNEKIVQSTENHQNEDNKIKSYKIDEYIVKMHTAAECKRGCSFEP